METENLKIELSVNNTGILYAKNKEGHLFQFLTVISDDIKSLDGGKFILLKPIDVPEDVKEKSDLGNAYIPMVPINLYPPDNDFSPTLLLHGGGGDNPLADRQGLQSTKRGIRLENADMSAWLYPLVTAQAEGSVVLTLDWTK